MFRVDAASGAVTRLTGNGHAGNVQPLPGGGALYTLNSIMAPDDLYRLDAARQVRAADPGQRARCSPSSIR